MKFRLHPKTGIFGLALVTASLSPFGSPAAQAASINWTGTTNSLWDTGSNWSGSLVPTSLDDLTILGPLNVAGALNVNIAAAATANSISFTNTAATTLTNTTSGANQTLTIGAGGLTTGTGAVTIGSSTANQGINVALGASQTWNIGSGGLSVANAISGTGFGITKTGAGTLVLSGANTYTGATAISTGTLEFRGASSMSTGSALSMANGSTLSLKSDTNATFSPASFSNFTAGSTYNIAIGSVNGSATGQTLSIIAPAAGGGAASATTLNVSGNPGAGYALKLTSAFQTNSNSGSAWTNSFNNIFNLTDADVILDAGMSMGNNGNGGITVNSSTGNTLTINGNITTNTNRTSNAVVSSGTLTLNNTVSLGGTNQGFWVTLNGGTLNVNNAGAIRNNSVISGTRAGLVLAGGILNNTSGSAITLTYNPTVLLNGDFSFATSASTSANNLNLGTGIVNLGTVAGASRTITTNGAAVLTLGGVISNGTNATTPTINLTKSGTGSLVLSGANTFTGGVTIKSGTVKGMTNAAAFGTGTVTIGDTSGSANATLEGAGILTFANAISVASGNTGTAKLANNDTNTQTYSGTLTLNSHDLMLAGSSTGGMTFSGAISGTGTIINSGAGAGTSFFNGGSISGGIALRQNSTTSLMDLQSANTATGGLFIDAGAVMLHNIDSAVGSANAVQLGAVSGSANAEIRAANNGRTWSMGALTVNSGTGSRTITFLHGGGINATISPASIALNNNLSVLAAAGFDHASVSTVTLAGTVSGTGNLTLASYSTYGNTSSNLTISGAQNQAGAITIADPTTYSPSYANTGAVIFSGALGSGITSVTQNSATNVLNLNAANTAFAGNLSINAGTVKLGTANALNVNNTVAVASGAKLDLNNNSNTIAGLTGAGTATNSGATAKVLTMGGSGAYSFSGSITDGSTAGNMSLVKTGSGTQTLSGTSTFSGGVGLSQGTLVFGNADALGMGTLALGGGTLKAGGAYTLTNSITVSSTAALDMAGNNTTFSGAISGSGGLTLSNSGFASTLTLSGNNSLFTGTFTAGNGNALNFTSANSGSADAAWVFNDANVDRVRINIAGGGTLHFGALSGSGQIQNDTASTSSTLSVGALGTSTTFSGTIKDNGTGTLGLTKTGSGTLTLTGANAYSGLTSVNAGTLALGATGSINGTSGVSLGSGGTFDVSAKTGGYSVDRLSGSGTVVGSLSITTELAIGNSPGTSNFQNLTLGALSTFTYELDGGSSSADLGIVSGDLTISTGAVLDLVQLGTYTTNDKFTLFGYQTGHLTGTFAGLSDGAVFTDAGGDWKINYFDTTSGLNGGTGTSFVTVTAVPEPRAALIGGVGLLMLLRRRK